MSSDALAQTEEKPRETADAIARRTNKLLAAAREGDDWAFEELLRLHRSQVYGLALSLLGNPEEAIDICQDVFLRFFKALRSLRAERGIRAWLRRVTVNRCYDVLRARVRNRDLKAELMPSCMYPDEKTDFKEISHAVVKSLDILSPRERAALMLTCHQGFSSIEAGETMGCRPATVRSLVFKAREKLRRALGIASGGNGL